MKIIRLLLLCVLLTSFTKPQRPPQGKLLVLIAVDGLRGDMLEKFRPAFSHGFKRMFDEGFNYKNTWDNHAITVSHAGHVTLATGNYPRSHGIVDAAFYEKSGDSLRFTDAFADSAFTVTGAPDRKSISEKKVLTPGLAEWVKNRNPAGKVFCVGTGEISSALYCFHPGEDVYWYNTDLGRYVTSTYFKKEVPGWINDFNEKRLPEYFKMSKQWDNIVPEQYLGLANKDDAEFENGGEKHTFPYIAPESVQKENRYNNWFRFPPFCDNATLALAEQGIESLKIGQGMTTDYLSIVLSQVDNTNHSFGPSSLESFNVLMQMDIALGEFYDYLDEKVGKGNYVVALSADHGFPEIPEQTQQKGKPARRLGEKKIENVLAEVKHITGNLKGKSNSEIAAALKTHLMKLDFIADVYTPAQLNNKTVSCDKFLELYKKSHRSDRVPRLPFFSLYTFQSEIGKYGVMVRLKKDTMIDLDTDIHGSPYEYDRYVPLLFMGMGIKKGSSNTVAYTVDVAPTLAKLAGIPVTGHIDGKPLF